VINVEQDPDHPTRPKINYVGEMDGKFSVVGYVKFTPDNQIRWHFVSLASGQLGLYCHADVNIAYRQLVTETRQCGGMVLERTVLIR
jgi:hypothetical protein